MNEHFFNVEGPPGESVFRRLFAPCLSGTGIEDIYEQNRNYIQHLASVTDDRAIVLVGALLVENATNRFLQSVLPGFHRLSKDRDLTFSLRIKFAEASQVCPKHIWQAAECVRQIRNEFAHDLELSRFSQLASKFLQLLRANAHKLNIVHEGEEPGKHFCNVVLVTTLGIHAYTHHAALLSEYVRTPTFYESFSHWVELRMAQSSQEPSEEGPTTTWGIGVPLPPSL